GFSRAFRKLRGGTCALCRRDCRLAIYGRLDESGHGARNRDRCASLEQPRCLLGGSAARRSDWRVALSYSFRARVLIPFVAASGRNNAPLAALRTCLTLGIRY